MKSRESGMPAQSYWESLFDVPLILDRFAFGPELADVAELGCGYGTFTVPLASRIRGVVHAFDIEPEMVQATQRRASEAGVTNLRAMCRDVLEQGYDLADESCDAGLLFNILHGDSPVEMLRETARVVRQGGMIAVIHWRTDIDTPRGPGAGIRPEPRQIVQWTDSAGHLVVERVPFMLPPWHYGLKLRKE
jgi:SAM-dependent methyltransferase